MKELIALAREEGFSAAVLAPDRIPVNPEFRAYCEENRCGKFGANYSCPPDCGTPEQLHRNILAEEWVLVFTACWQIDGFADREGIDRAKRAHNAATLRLMEKVRSLGFEGFAAGYNGCPLCDPCKRMLKEPCAFPDKRISCLSAYCVDVAGLAKECGLEFSWTEGALHLFGMIAYHSKNRR